MNEIVAFNNFNRYYIRALLSRANDETGILQVYRTKQSKTERNESKSNVGKVYSNKEKFCACLTFSEIGKDFSRSGLIHLNLIQDLTSNCTK